MLGVWKSEKGYTMRVEAEINGLYSCVWIGKGGGFMATQKHILKNFKKVGA